MNIPWILRAFSKLDIVQDTCECAVNDGLLRTYFQTRSFLGCSSRQLGKLDDTVPALWRSEADDRGGRVHLLVRPEGPADVVLLEHRDKLRNPFIGVFAGFSKPDRHVVLIAEVDIFLHRRLLCRSVIAVKSVYSVFVEWRLRKRRNCCPTGHRPE